VLTIQQFLQLLYIRASLLTFKIRGFKTLKIGMKLTLQLQQMAGVVMLLAYNSLNESLIAIQSTKQAIDSAYFLLMAILAMSI